MCFPEVLEYEDNLPEDRLERYVYDINMLAKDDPNIQEVLLCDIDYLIFKKKLLSIGNSDKYRISIKDNNNHVLEEDLYISKHIVFKPLEEKFLRGAVVTLAGREWNVGMPTLKEFKKVLAYYVRLRKTTDIRLIRLISLIEEFDKKPNLVENSVLHAEKDDITKLAMLDMWYFERVEPITVVCEQCRKIQEEAGDFEKGGKTKIGLGDLIVSFLRDVISNNPINPNELVFK